MGFGCWVEGVGFRVQGSAGGAAEVFEFDVYPLTRTGSGVGRHRVAVT